MNFSPVSGVFLSFLFFPLLSPFFSLSSCLSYLVDREPLVLLHPAVDARRGEVALAQEAVELLGSRDRADKDDDLVESSASSRSLSLRFFSPSRSIT